MRSILGFAGVVAAVAVASSMAQGQAGRIILKGEVVPKPTSECDAVCQLHTTVNGLARRLVDAENENVRQTKKIIELEENIKAMSSLNNKVATFENQLSNEGKTLFVYGVRLTGLEVTANQYRSHTHSMHGGFGFTKQGNLNMVFVDGKDAFTRPTSGPQQH